MISTERNFHSLLAWNHNPVDDKWSLTERPGYLRLETSRVVDNLYLAPNTITQRMEGPKCKATVSLDISNMKDGDVAGFSAFNGHSGLLSVVKEGDAKTTCNVHQCSQLLIILQIKLSQVWM